MGLDFWSVTLNNHLFITNHHSILTKLNHIFITFLPSYEIQLDHLKPLPRKHVLKLLGIKKSQMVWWVQWMVYNTVSDYFSYTTPHLCNIFTLQRNSFIVLPIIAQLLIEHSFKSCFSSTINDHIIFNFLFEYYTKMLH